MNLFRKIFKGGDKSPSEGVADPILRTAQKIVDANLPLARYLVSAGRFNREKMERYISLAEEALGKEAFDPAQKATMMEADKNIMPKSMSDGTVADGFEVLRWDMFRVHMDNVQASIRLLRESPSADQAASYLLSVMKQVEDLRGQLQP